MIYFIFNFNIYNNYYFILLVYNIYKILKIQFNNFYYKKYIFDIIYIYINLYKYKIILNN